MSSPTRTRAKALAGPTFTPTHAGLLQRQCACGGRPGLDGECAACRGKRLAGGAPPLVQTKLKIGRPGDRFEREADRVADQVMCMPEPQVQRQVEPGKEEDEDLIQTKEAAGSTPSVTPGLAARIQLLQGGGQPLPESTRAFFEPRFGYDFSQVRVHSNARAAEAAQAVGAHAFTLGRDIVFARGQYRPDMVAGRKLLGHELTHVVQQQRAADRHNIIQKVDEEEPPGLARQSALLSAILVIIENVGDRLLNAVGTEGTETNGSIFAKLVPSLAGATVAGVLAKTLTFVVASEISQAAASEFLTNVAEDSAGEIVEANRDGDLDLEKFVREWKIRQRRQLLFQFKQVSAGKQGKSSDLQRALAVADINPAKLQEVENMVFRKVLSLYLHAIRESTLKRHEASFFGDYSGSGWAHILLEYPNKERAHVDLIGFETADMKSLSEAFELNGFDPAQVGIPVVLTIHRSYPPGSLGYGSGRFHFETWWVSVKDGQLRTEKYMQYSDTATTSRRAGGEGSIRRAKDQAPNSLWRQGFGLKLPVTAGFSARSVPIKDWHKVNIT